MDMLIQLCWPFQPNSSFSPKNQSIKHLPTTFNLQKCYHPVSFICAWSMPQHKIKRKEKYSSNEAELSLLVYLPYLFMTGVLPAGLMYTVSKCKKRRNFTISSIIHLSTLLHIWNCPQSLIIARPTILNLIF